MKPRRRLLTIGHSYVVALNRRLAQEMARTGREHWEVTAVAPRFVHGDLRSIELEASENEQCSLIPIPTYFSKRIVVMAYGPSLRQILSREKWDIVHAWEEPYVLSSMQIAGWTPARSHYVFATFQNQNKSYVPPFHWVERYCVQRSRGWIAFGKTIDETMKKRPVYPHKPSRVIPLGVDTEVFRPDPAARRTIQTQLGWSQPGPPIIGYLGRFVEEKGISLLMRVLDSLQTPWRAMFVGGGDLLEPLQKWAQRYPDRVRIVTGVKHDQVPAYLNAMDLLVAPSLTFPRWREQLGRMLLEAFACGIPVIGSDSGEIPTVIGDAGCILEEGNETAWRDGICRLLGSPSERQRLASLGLARVQQEFTWPLVARKHLDFFDALL